MKTYSFTFTAEEAQMIVQALRNEAFQLSQESRRACEKHARDYGTILWESSIEHNALSDRIDLELPF